MWPLRRQTRELAALRGGDAFDLRSTPKRLARLRKDPWEGFAEKRQSIRAALLATGVR